MCLQGSTFHDIELGNSSSSSSSSAATAASFSNLQQEFADCVGPLLQRNNSNNNTNTSMMSSFLRMPLSSSTRKYHDVDTSSSSTTISNSKNSDTSTTTSPSPSSLLDSLPSSQQMILLSFLMFLFFGMHNILQEAIVNLLSNIQSESSDGGNGGGMDTTTTTTANDKFTVMLGYTEIVGVLTFSYLERLYCTNEGGLTRVAPLRSYPLLTACLFASSALSNLSLSYINFPTKVVFRSCKLIPTMIIATIVNSKKFRSYEYLCAFCICAGLVLYSMAEYSLDPLQFNSLGLVLVSGSVVADSILPNAQEHLFKEGSSRLEVTVYSNLYSFIGITVITLGNGTLLQFGTILRTNSTLAMYFAIYTILSYASISCYMILVKRFGGVTAVVLTTARKAMTLVLSFMLFPKGFSWLYVYGSLLVLGAVMMASICKKMGGRGAPSLVSRDKKSSMPNKGDYAPLSTIDESSDEVDGVLMSNIALFDNSQLESCAAAILDGISKRAYI